MLDVEPLGQTNWTLPGKPGTMVQPVGIELKVETEITGRSQAELAGGGSKVGS